MAALQDYQTFYQRESHLRRVMLYPPFAAMANFIVRARRREPAQKAAATIAEELRAAGGDQLRLLGPALAPIERVRYNWRAQVLVRSKSRAVLRRALEAARNRIGRSVQGVVVDVDVDPVHLL